MSLEDWNKSTVWATGDMRPSERTRLVATGGDGNTDEHREVHLMMTDGEGAFAQAWFRLDELMEALEYAVEGS